MGALLSATEKGRRVARPRTAGFGVQDVGGSDILTPRMLGGGQKREHRVNPSLAQGSPRFGKAMEKWGGPAKPPGGGPRAHAARR